MKKNILIIILSMLPGLLSAQQKFSNSEKMLISSRIDSLILNFMQYSTLKRSGDTKRSDYVCKEFRKLFNKDAKVYDDINPLFDEASKDYPYRLLIKDFQDYYDGLLDEFPSGFIVNYKHINVNYERFDEGYVRIAMERNIDGVNVTKHHFFNEDTLKITVEISPLDKTVKISDISLIRTSTKFKVLNDQDYDGVVDAEDQCKDIKGKILLNGCPDADNDGIPDKDDDCPDLAGERSNGGCPPSTFAYRFVFSGSLGYQMNNNTIHDPESTPVFNMDKERSQFGKVESPGLSGSVVLAANIAYYFGKNANNRNKGISIGFTATHYSADYNISKVEYQYQASDGFNDYRRITSLNQATEALSFSIINIPIMLKIKSKIDAKWAWELGAGPSLISFITTTDAKANFAYEGIYIYDGGTFIYNPHYVPESTDVLLTAANMESKLFNPDANALFDLMGSSYDFSEGREVSKAKTVDSRSGFAFNASAELFYHVTKNMAFKSSFTFTIAPSITHSTDDYMMMNKSTDEYNSIYNSNAKSTYTAFGIGVGIILGI